MEGCLCFQCVTTSEIGIIERCGRYERLAPPGLRCVCWPLETVAGRISRRIQQLDVACETKTSDNVFLNVIISVQYKVKEEYVYEAFYVLNDPAAQIKSYVYDVVRSTLPLLTLDKAFESKEMVALAACKPNFWPHTIEAMFARSSQYNRHYRRSPSRSKGSCQGS